MREARLAQWIRAPSSGESLTHQLNDGSSSSWRGFVAPQPDLHGIYRQLATPEQLRRLRWRWRRGLLENDLMLERFLQSQAADLDEDRLAAANELLALDDKSLWDLIAGRAEVSEPRLWEILEMIRAS